MDKVKEFQTFLDKNLEEFVRVVVFNRNPISIEFHQAQFYSEIVKEFVRLNDIPQTVVNPEIAKEELVEVAKQIRRYNRNRHRIQKKVKLTEL